MCKQMTPVVRPVCTVASIESKVFVSAEIQEIRKNGSEDHRIEIKKAAGGCPKIYDTLSSFSTVFRCI